MSREHAYAYEAGYRDGSINYELEHCPACKNVADLQEALAENAKLREELEAVGTAAYLYGRTDLAAENAKLRELAAGIGHLLFKLDVDYCAGCPRDDINHPCPVYTVKGGECLYETDLRELGVEVDG